MLFQLVNFCISLIAVAIVMVYFKVAPSLSLLMLPVLLLFVVLFSAGLGLAASALAVFFPTCATSLERPLIHRLKPMPPRFFYPVVVLPDWMMPIMELNPMYHYVSYFRQLLLDGTIPGLQDNESASAWP